MHLCMEWMEMFDTVTVLQYILVECYFLFKNKILNLIPYTVLGSVQFSRSVVSDSLMPSSHLILCRPLLLLPPIPPRIRVFSNESTLRMRWPKYWSFSFSIVPSKEHPGLISFRMDWLDLLSVQRTLKHLSSPTPQFKSINSSVLSFLHSPTLTSIHDYWKNHSLD